MANCHTTYDRWSMLNIRSLIKAQDCGLDPSSCVERIAKENMVPSGLTARKWSVANQHFTGRARYNTLSFKRLKISNNLKWKQSLPRYFTLVFIYEQLAFILFQFTSKIFLTSTAEKPFNDIRPAEKVVIPCFKWADL